MPWFRKAPRSCLVERPKVRVPKPLKKRSGRAGQRLTFLESDEGRLSVIGSQPNSRLMTLPREIRDSIWHECLSGLTIELVIEYHLWPSQTYLQLRKPAVHVGLLSLAQSCRQGYIESIRILYEDNIFHVSLPEYLDGLVLTLMPQHLSCIRELEYYSTLDEPPARDNTEHQKWMAVWKNIGAFTGLRKLHLHIAIPRTWPNTLSHQESIMQEDANSFLSSESLQWIFTWHVF